MLGPERTLHLHLRDDRRQEPVHLIGCRATIRLTDKAITRIGLFTLEAVVDRNAGDAGTRENFACSGNAGTSEEFAFPGSAGTSEDFALPGSAESSKNFALPGDAGIREDSTSSLPPVGRGTRLGARFLPKTGQLPIQLWVPRIGGVYCPLLAAGRLQLLWGGGTDLGALFLSKAGQ